MCERLPGSNILAPIPALLAACRTPSPFLRLACAGLRAIVASGQHGYDPNKTLYRFAMLLRSQAGSAEAFKSLEERASASRTGTAAKATSASLRQACLICTSPSRIIALRSRVLSRGVARVSSRSCRDGAPETAYSRLTDLTTVSFTSNAPLHARAPRTCSLLTRGGVHA